MGNLILLICEGWICTFETAKAAHLALSKNLEVISVDERESVGSKKDGECQEPVIRKYNRPAKDDLFRKGWERIKTKTQSAMPPKVMEWCGVFNQQCR